MGYPNPEFVDKAKRMAQYGGNYVTQLSRAEWRGLALKGSVAHESMQLLSWIHILLDGRDVVAWKTDTEGIIQKLKDGAGRLYDLVEKLDKEKPEIEPGNKLLKTGNKRGKRY